MEPHAHGKAVYFLFVKRGLDSLDLGHFLHCCLLRFLNDIYKFISNAPDLNPELCELENAYSVLSKKEFRGHLIGCGHFIHGYLDMLCSRGAQTDLVLFLNGLDYFKVLNEEFVLLYLRGEG
jgi:hypothetical protein